MEILRFTLKFIIIVLVKIGDIVLFCLEKTISLPFYLLRRLVRETSLAIKKIFSSKNSRKEALIYQSGAFVKVKPKTRVVYGKNKAAKRKSSETNYLLVFKSKLKFFLLGVIFSLFVIFLPLLGFIFVSELPSPYSLSLNLIPKTTKIFDRNNNLLYEIYINQNRTIVNLSEIPKFLKDATIAIEDKNFYNHPGFDVKGIGRALVANIKNRAFLQGGSTITQQLVKSAYLTPEVTLSRKVKEIVLAFLTEKVYSKDKILELYFNFVPYGGTAWGVQAASKVYFDKNVAQLDLAESAFLAGLPKAPTIYSPYHGNLWKERQKEVLDAMVRLGYISKIQAEEAFAKELVFKPLQTPIKAPHFVMYIRDLLIQKYGLSEVERGGLKVKTTLDINLQEMAEKIVSDEVDSNLSLNIKNGAAVISDPSNGDILAMVGNKNYFDKENGGNVNIATSLRQPGSSIKIVTYALALLRGFTESTSLDDSPLTINLPEGAYAPVNYDGKFHGRLQLRYAFANSLNIPAVRVAQRLGVDNIVRFGKEMGISSWGSSNKYGYSITLGGADVTMLDMATVYGVIANGGKMVPLDPVLEILDFAGKPVYKKEPTEKQIVDEGVSFIVSDILADNNARSLEFGLNSPLKIDGHRVSVKTGTSDNKRDNWTIGYAQNFVVAAWVGNNDNTPMSQNLASGITGAAPIWNKIMKNLLFDKKDEPIIIPGNVIKKNCLGREAYFIKGTENSIRCVLPTPTPIPTPKP